MGRELIKEGPGMGEVGAGGLYGDLFQGYLPKSTYLRWGRRAGKWHRNVGVVEWRLQTCKQTRVKILQRYFNSKGIRSQTYALPKHKFLI